MKVLPHIIIFIIITNACYSQDLIFQFTTHNFNSVTINDSSVVYESGESIYSFHLKKFYSSSKFFKSSNGDSITVNYYSDTTILFQEYDSLNKLICSGEFEVDKKKLLIIPYEYPFISESGEEIPMADTSYYLIPKGMWYFNIDNYLYELVNFEKGVRNGLSVIKFKSTCLPDSIVISEKLFTNGILKYQSNFELSSVKSIRTTIEGTWYHPNCMDYIYQENPVWVFQRNKPNSTVRNGMFTSKFILNGRYEGKMNYSCGTGRSKDDYYPNYKWEINDNKEIIIGATKYTILYLDKDIMILKETTNHNMH